MNVHDREQLLYLFVKYGSDQESLYEEVKMLIDAKLANLRYACAEIAEAAVIPGHQVQEPSVRDIAKKINEILL